MLVIAMLLGLAQVGVGSNQNSGGSAGMVAQAAPAGFLKLGDYVQFGSYLGAPIIWRVMNIDTDGNPILFADKVLSFKVFDSKGPFHKNADRKDNGSNNYVGSNLRQWLNSSEKTIAWTQNAPSLANLGQTYHSPYDTETGFLADGNFSAKERALIVPFTHKVMVAEYDANQKDGGTERHAATESQSMITDMLQNYDTTAFFKNVTDTVFLLSVKQAKEWVADLGYPLVTKATQQAADAFNKQSNYTETSPGYIDVNDDMPYWLNTPTAGSTFLIRYIDGDNDRMYNDTPSTGWYGVRPALKLNLAATTFRIAGRGTLAAPHTVNTKGRIDVVGRSISLDGKPLSLGAGVEPTIISGSTMVPFRAIFQALGMNVSFNSTTKTILATQGTYRMQLTIGSRNVLINNTTTKVMPVAPNIIRGTTMVPLRFISEETGLDVTYRAR